MERGREGGDLNVGIGKVEGDLTVGKEGGGDLVDLRKNHPKFFFSRN